MTCFFKYLAATTLAFSLASSSAFADSSGVYDSTTTPTLGDGTDYMAYAEIPAVVMTLWDGTNTSRTVVVADTDTTSRHSVGDDIWLNNKITSTYSYNGSVALGTNYASGSGISMKVLSLRSQYVLIVHNQVYRYFGFDTHTATSEGVVGYNTKKMDENDKSFVTEYLKANGISTHATPKALKEGGNDYDLDGIPDGWELYVGSDPYWYDDRTTDWDQDNVALYQEYDNGNFPTDPNNQMTFYDDIRDDFARNYHLKGSDAYNDNDGDGLPNYAEYLISEVFKFAKLDPDNPMTDMSCVDYFRKKGDLYYGEIFTDHDMIPYEWEQKYGRFANAEAWDGDRDDDSDGWSNYAEWKAGTNPQYAKVPGGQDTGDRSFPVPLIKAHVVYNGNTKFDTPIVFQAWRWQETSATNSSQYGAYGDGPYAMTTVPDAQWTATSESATTNGTKYIGQNPGKEVSFHVGSRGIAIGSLRIRFRDISFENSGLRDGVNENSESEASSTEAWYYFAQDYGNGVIFTSVSNKVPVAVGTVDYATGIVTIDFGCEALQSVAYERETTTSAGTATISGSSTTGKSAVIFKNYSKFDLARSYVKVEWTPLVVETSIDSTYFLTDCDDGLNNLGHIREGKNQFVAFADLDEDGKYTPGEPFGYVKDIDVGWDGGEFSVELTEVNPVFPRIDLTTGKSDRDYWMPDNGTINPLFSTGAYHVAKGHLLSNDNRKTWISVVRYAVNGTVCPTAKVLFSVRLDPQVRPYLHEGDVLRFTDAVDLDWHHLANDYSSTLTAITNVTYALVYGWHFKTIMNNGVISFVIDDLDNAFSYTIGRQYTLTKTPVQAYQNLPGFAYGARPTFKWKATKMVNWLFTDTDYAAFSIDMYSGNTKAYSSGIRTVPPKDADGRYVWTMDEPIGLKLATSGDFTWKVKMYNSKYNTGSDDTTASTGVFTSNVNNQQPMNDHGFSSIAAAVKYAGPETVLSKVSASGTKGKVIVEAYETGDFSGVPSGASYVTSATSIKDTSHVVSNAVVKGLHQNGIYYLRAFIDSNGNGEKDAFESWGAAPAPVYLTPDTLRIPTVAIWIEDADTDGDWYPDAYEYAMNGWNGTWDACMNQRKWSVIGGDTLLFSETVNSAGISTGLGGATMTIFQNSTIGSSLMSMSSSATSSFGAIRKTAERLVNPDKVRITAVSLASDGSKAVLSVEDEVSLGIAGKVMSRFYNISNFSASSATLTVHIYRKETLASDDWIEVTPAKTATVYKSSVGQVDVPLTGINMKSNYYKIEVTQ